MNTISASSSFLSSTPSPDFLSGCTDREFELCPAHASSSAMRLHTPSTFTFFAVNFCTSTGSDSALRFLPAAAVILLSFFEAVFSLQTSCALVAPVTCAAPLAGEPNVTTFLLPMRVKPAWTVTFTLACPFSVLASTPRTRCSILVDCSCGEGEASWMVLQWPIMRVEASIVMVCSA